MSTLQAVIHIRLLKSVEKSMRRFSLLLTAILVTACGGSTEPTSITGTYTVRTVNGNAPPTLLFDDGSFRNTLKSGSLSLRTDMTYTLERTINTILDSNPSSGGDSQFTETGTYQASGSGLFLTADGQSTVTYSMQMANGQITWTLSEGGHQFVYLFAR